MIKDIINQIKKLAKETNQMKKSQFFKSYLTTMSKFWNYSYYNQLLIQQQCPKAKKVAGYQTWKKLKRKVKKGEKAINILAPIIVDKDEKIVGFRKVNVFDISQTKGKPLPKLDIDIEGNNKKLLKKLLIYCNKNNIKVYFRKLNENLYGYNKNNLIVINKNKSINTQINTLIHELSHEKLHKYSKLNKQEKEIQAEAVAYVICKYFNLNPKSFNYLELYDGNYEKIMKNLEVISNCVKDIIENL